MRTTTFRIAKTELNNLFYSPIAWLLLIVFFFQCSLTYTNILSHFLTSQELGGFMLRMSSLQSWTAATFGSRGGLFGDIMTKVYLYIPLLTMGLISREVSSGTIRLLYSSPVSVTEIVFGKFLGMMIYSLLLIVIAVIFIIAGSYNIRLADMGMLFSGLLGLYLLLCAYSAIGLFMSSLTSYQVAAAIGTLVIFAALNYIGLVWQDIDFVRSLTYFLSISGRTEHMLGGLITTKDVLYFLVVIYMFLGFSICKLRDGRESTSRTIRVGRYAAIVVSALTIGYVTSLPGLIGYYDATAAKSNTLTPNAQRAIQQLKDGDLEITSYVNLLDATYQFGSPKERNRDITRWEPYVRFKSDIRFRYVYYYDSSFSSMSAPNPNSTLKGMAEINARAYQVDLSDFESPEQIRKEINLRPERNRYVMQLKYKGRSTFLRIFDDMQAFPTETETSAALQRLVSDSIPKIGVLTGDMERSIYRVGDADYNVLTSFMTYRNSLLNQGFDMEEVSLRNEEIPSYITILVIADPKTAFDSVSTEKIKRYIAAGGNLFIAGEPGRQSLLNPILQPLGVHMKEGMLIQQSKDFDPALVVSRLTKTAAAFSPLLQKGLKEIPQVTMQGAAALSFDSNSSFNIRPLLMTDETQSWNRKKISVVSMAAGEVSSDNNSNAGNGQVQKAGLSGMSVRPLALEPQIGPRPGQMPAMLTPAMPAQMASAASGKPQSLFGSTPVASGSVSSGGHLPVVSGAVSPQPGAISSQPGSHLPVSGKAPVAAGSSSLTSAQTAPAAGLAPAQAGQASSDTPTTTTTTIMLGGKPVTVTMAKGYSVAKGQLKLPQAQSAQASGSQPLSGQPMQGQPVMAQGQVQQGAPVSASTPVQTTPTLAQAAPTSLQATPQQPARVVHSGRPLTAATSAAKPAAQPLPGKSKTAPVASSFESTFSTADGDEHGSFPTAVCLTRSVNGKEQRVVVTSDADFMSNVELRRMNIPTANFIFGDGIFSWLGYGKFPIETSRPDPKDIRLNLGQAGLKVLKTLLLGVFPALLLILGTVILIRRKRK